MAYLDNESLKLDTQFTFQFFQQVTENFKYSTSSMSTIKTILQSLITYHLQAEMALQSIDIHRKNLILTRYRALAFRADLNLKKSVLFDDGNQLGYLFDGIFEWTTDYWKKAQRHQLKDYMCQKLFVIMLHILEITPGRLSVVRDHSLCWAAKAVARFGTDRLCISEGIMLSVFFRSPFSDIYNTWNLEDIGKRLAIPTLWEDALGVDPRKSSITTYMENIMFPVEVPPHYPPESPYYHVHQNFVKEIMTFVELTHGNNMKSTHCIHLLDWAAKVWDRLFPEDTTDEQVGLKMEFRAEMKKIKQQCGIQVDAMMQQLRLEGAGPGNQGCDLYGLIDSSPSSGRDK
jgi:flagellar biosynthesis regulator FlaF